MYLVLFYVFFLWFFHRYNPFTIYYDLFFYVLPLTKSKASYRPLSCVTPVSYAYGAQTDYSTATSIWDLILMLIPNDGFFEMFL